MPCNDVTELLELRLDAGDRIDSFSLQKNTCGAPVGNALLLRYVAGLAAETLLDSTLAELVPQVLEARHIDQFLLTKQLYALQEALAVYTGRASGGLDEAFTVEQIAYTPEGASITGLVKVDVVAERIRACGDCGCAAKRLAKAAS